jgi:hypothetical protein
MLPLFHDKFAPRLLEPSIPPQGCSLIHFSMITTGPSFNTESAQQADVRSGVWTEAESMDRWMLRELV